MYDNYDESIIENTVVSIEDLHRLKEELLTTGKDKLFKKYGKVVLGLEDLLVYGVLILDLIMQKYKINSLLVSSRGLRYGAIVKELLLIGESPKSIIC
jgi:exopolyphosphatase/pppGpp-phosphohydrolase